ncbi:hypothetical protein Nepgr_006704 [Nepenthes gracilis]|uniref:Uncharacterized protein n=1 Tax=Nepenthes gracilis TaxID=150966 RepID=A0AAD3S5J4_NEPGR|nr:hypothetical protein Nepgr_006704 [Nepenthes gracilis]
MLNSGWCPLHLLMEYGSGLAIVTDDEGHALEVCWWQIGMLLCQGQCSLLVSTDAAVKWSLSIYHDGLELASVCEDDAAGLGAGASCCSMLAWGWSFVPLPRSSPGFSQSWAARKFLISNMPKTSPGSGDGDLLGCNQISSTCLEVACYIFELAGRVGDFLYCVLSLVGSAPGSPDVAGGDC